MAKKKKSNPAGGAIILAISFLGAIVLLASFLAIFVLIGIRVYFARAIKRYPGVSSQEDIRLSAEEQKQLNEYRETRDQCLQRRAQIEKRKHDLLVRKDGKFDSRNKEGRALNTELETLRNELSTCNEEITRLASWERLTYREWVTNKSGLFASRIAVFSLPVSIAAFLVITPSSMLALSALIERQVGLAHPGQFEGFYGAVAFGAWSSIALFLFLWALSSIAAPKFASAQTSE